MEVLVLGAGPVGLMLGCQLARYKVPFRIIDRQAAPTPHCKAVGFQARSLEIFEDLGLEGHVLSRGVNLRAQNVYRDGDCVARQEFNHQPTPEIPYPYMYVFEQSATESCLQLCLESLGAHVERQVECLEVDLSGERARVRLRHPDGREETVSPRFLVGCDGAHSLVRKTAGISFEGEAYAESYMLADARVRGPLVSNEAYRFTRGDEFLLAVPLPYSRFRLTTLDRRLLQGQEGHGLTQELDGPDAAEMQAVLERLGPPGLQIEEVRWSSRYRISRRLAGAYRAGSAFLCGDAAHIHSPRGGQGMNTGLQDAYNLGWKLGLVVSGQARSELLDSYELERRPVAQAVLESTHAAMQAPPGESESLARWAQLDVNYRGTAGVWQPDGHRGPLQAGDRASDGVLVDAHGNLHRLFHRFRGTRFHLLAFQNAQVPGLHRLEAWEDRLDILHIRTERGDELADPDGRVAAAYGAERPCLVVVRPDGYVGCWADADGAEQVMTYLDSVFTPASLRI